MEARQDAHSPESCTSIDCRGAPFRTVGMTKSSFLGGKIRDVLRFSSNLLVWHSAGADAALLTVASS